LQAQQQQHVLPQPAHPTPQIYTYSHGASSTSPPHYQKPADINIHPTPTTVAPLTAPQEYVSKNVAPIQYAIKKPATSFQQYYSPGLEYHYTDVVPSTKLAPQQYHQVNYQTPVAPVAPVQQYQPQSYLHQPGTIAGIQHHYYPGFNTVNPYVPNFLSYQRQQQLKAYIQQQQQLSSAHHYQPYHQVYPQPQQVQHQYQPYPTTDAYNTIKYSIPLPPYDHSKRSVEHAKRSVAKATSTKLQPTKN
jgi:hypothetical protein